VAEDSVKAGLRGIFVEQVRSKDAAEDIILFKIEQACSGAIHQDILIIAKLVLVRPFKHLTITRCITFM